MSKKVLLTGASGLIGSHVLAYILEHTDWDVTCISAWRHKGSPTRITGSNFYESNKNRITIFTHDLRGEIPDTGDFDYILHLASLSHVDTSVKDPVNFIENNVSITLQVLEYARKHKPEAFILFSTDEVTGTVEVGEKVEEWALLMPRNPYSSSKACQEMIAQAYYHTYKVPVVITNTNNAIGVGQDIEKFLPRIIKAVENDDKVMIHTNNGSIGSRYYNPVTNMADALLFILNNLTPKVDQDKPDKYMIGGGKQFNNLELAQTVAEAMGKDLKYELVDVSSIRPAYDQHYPCGGDRLFSLGWKPPVTFEQELHNIIRSIK